MSSVQRQSCWKVRPAQLRYARRATSPGNIRFSAGACDHHHCCMLGKGFSSCVIGMSAACWSTESANLAACFGSTNWNACCLEPRAQCDLDVITSHAQHTSGSQLLRPPAVISSCCNDLFRLHDENRHIRVGHIEAAHQVWQGWRIPHIIQSMTVFGQTNASECVVAKISIASAEVHETNGHPPQIKSVNIVSSWRSSPRDDKALTMGS